MLVVAVDGMNIKHTNHVIVMWRRTFKIHVLWEFICYILRCEARSHKPNGAQPDSPPTIQYNTKSVTHFWMLQECATLMTWCQWVQHAVNVWTHTYSIMPCQWPFCTALTPVTCKYPHCSSPFLTSLWMGRSSAGQGKSLRSSSLAPGYVSVSCRQM